MIQGGGGPGLPVESVRRLSGRERIVRQKLQSDRSEEPGILGLVHHTHSTPPELLDDPVVGHRAADRLIVASLSSVGALAGHRPRRDVHRRSRQKHPGLPLRPQQRPDFPLQRIIACARPVSEKRRAPRAEGPAPIATGAQPVSSAPRSSFASSPSSRYSQAFAARQSRLTVPVDNFSTLAISSTVSPAKNRISTICAFRGSISGQRDQCVVQGDEVHIRFLAAANDDGFVQRHMLDAADPASGCDDARAPRGCGASPAPTRRKSAPDSATACACNPPAANRLRSPGPWLAGCDRGARHACSGGRGGEVRRRRSA